MRPRPYTSLWLVLQDVADWSAFLEKVRKEAWKWRGERHSLQRFVRWSDAYISREPP